MHTTTIQPLVLSSLLILTLSADSVSQQGQAAPTTDKSSQGWVVPAEAKKLKNPVPITGQVLTATGPIYQANCARCHGEKGAANGREAGSLSTQSANLSDTRLIKESTDGELFWKLTHGRDPMPSFEQLSETQLWELVDYVRYPANRSQYRYLGAHSNR
jgi:mono/diheme cytochrome c family protein